MAESPKPSCDSSSLKISCEHGDLGKVGSLKMAISDQEGFPDRDERSDSCVVDMESLSLGTNKDITVNSRITLQASLSRKWSHKGERKITTTPTTTNSKDTATADASSKAALIGACTPEKSVMVPMGIGVQIIEPMNTKAQVIVTESRCSSRRYSGRRTPAWVFDPRRILFFFATLSSMGTIILIYFTLSIRKLNSDDIANAHQQ